MVGADVNAIPAWSHATGLGVKVAVIDGGFDPTHPDLLQEPGIDPIDDDTDASPTEGQDSPAHGTAVAGLASAIGNNELGVAGVAWQSSVIPVRLVGGGGTLADSYDAFALSVDQGAAVINNSWGYRTEDCAGIGSNPTMTDAISYAEEVGRGGLGTSVTFSMGNMACHNQAQPLLGHPASIGVGAINRRGNLHSYSNTGFDTDIVAPSTGLRTTDITGPVGMNGLGEDYTDAMGGTSGSCPLVSGVIALMYEANPRLTAAEVRQILCTTADRVNPDVALYDVTGWSDTYGCGRVDAGAAVAAVVNTAPDAPVFLTPEEGEAVEAGEFTLRWTVREDPDGEVLGFDLELRPLTLEAPGDDDDDSAEEAPEPAPLLYEDLTNPERRPRASDLPVGSWEAQVWARDAWGRGEGSALLFLEVLPAPAEEELISNEEEGEDAGQGCSCSDSSPAIIALLLGLPLPGLARRRRFHRE